MIWADRIAAVAFGLAFLFLTTVVAYSGGGLGSVVPAVKGALVLSLILWIALRALDFLFGGAHARAVAKAVLVQQLVLRSVVAKRVGGSHSGGYGDASEG